MRRQLWRVSLAVATAGLVAVSATSAYAFPSRSDRCSNCHSGGGVTVAATLVSNDGAKATYSVSAPGADAMAVFDGTAKVTSINGSSGTFTVANGKSYTVYAVAGPGTSDGLGSVVVSPVAPAPPVPPAPPADTTAPSTTSDARLTYADSATIRLTATDGGSGVASTYYRLDGGAAIAGTLVVVPTAGSHTLEYWSVDAAGNVEARKTAAFTVTVTPAPVVDLLAPRTVSDAVSAYSGTATIRLTAVDNAGGSGVAHTYYRIDGGATIEGTSLSIAATGTHTIDFWSVDAAGNIESPGGSATFSVAAPVEIPGEQTWSTIRAKRSRGAVMLSGAFGPARAGDVVTLYVQRSGEESWTAVSAIEVRLAELERDRYRYRREARDDDRDEGRRYDRRDDRRDDDREGAEDVRESLSTSSAASWSARFGPATSGTYRFQVRFAGDETRAASESRILEVRVR